MKLLKAILLALVFTSGGTALAGSWTAQHLGNFDYWNSSEGDNYSGQRLGNFYYWNGTDRYGNYHSGSGQRLGGFEYWNDDQN